VSLSVVQFFSSDTGVVTAPSPIGVHNVLLGYVNGDSSVGTPVTIIDTVNGAWPGATKSQDDTSGDRIAEYLFQNVAAGTPTFTASQVGAGFSPAIVIVEVGDPALTGSPDGASINLQNPGSGTDALVSGNMTNARQPAGIFGICFCAFTGGIGQVPATGTGFTNIGTGLFGIARFAWQRVTTRSSTQQAKFSATTSAEYVTGGIIVDELGATPGGLPIPTFVGLTIGL
jgi:hypothetical protein